MNIEDKKILSVSIRSRETILFEGQCVSVTSFNLRGRFDILPLHSNFITLISKYVILDVGKESEKKFDLEKGVLYVMSNKVNIYVGI